MSWKKISIAVVTLGLLFTMMIPTTVVAQTELHVGPGHPYATIQAAVGDASEGATIIVHADIYSELVEIGTNNLTLIGDGAILDGTAYPNQTDGLMTILPGVYGVTIEQFEICNFVFDDHGGNGIWIQEYSYGNTIRNNYIHDVNGAGVFLGEGSHDNLVTENYVFGCENGVGTNDSHHNQIIGNTTERNGIGIFMGVGSMGLGCSDNLISNNEDNRSIRYGISLNESSDNRVLENKVTKSGESGIFLRNSDSNTIEENEINKSGKFGIAAVGNPGSHGNLIKQNMVSKSRKYDLFQNDFSTNTWEENEYKKSNF